MIKLYKPRKDNNGHFFQFNVGKNNNKKTPYALYVKAVKQFSWTNGQGSFKENGENPEKIVRVKFNMFEAAGMLNGFETFFINCPKNDKGQNELDFFHSSEDNKTSIKLTAVSIQDRKGVFFSILQNKKSFRMPLTLAECTLVAEYCRFFIHKSAQENFQATMKNYKTQPLETKKIPQLLDQDLHDPFDKESPL